MNPPDRLECDVLIVGGGLVGSLLANALARLPLAVVLVEARSAAGLNQPSFDGRATALANGSQRVLDQLGLWSTIRAEAEAIRTIHIGQRGRFGAARIEARAEGVAALGYTVENRVLGTALWEPLIAAGNVTCLAPAELLEFDAVASAVTATVATAAGPQTIAARLLVAADGARSRLRAALGIDARVDDYRQHAIIVNCTTAEPAAGRAFERFMAAGPLAALPLTRNRIAIVWTQPETAAERILGLSDADFRAELQAAFGWRLGRIRQVGARDRHRLQRVRSENLIGERTVLIGNAANALHPVAGQGFNLALRDVAALAELLADALAAGAADIGAAAVLGAYRDWRAADQRRLTSFTHALVQGFGASLPGLATARGLGLVAFDLLPGAKSLLARHTMGLAGRVPRLARRLDLA